MYEQLVTMADEFSPKCNVCLCEFSDKLVPLNLNCGHSVCSSCVDQIVCQYKACPECRQTFTGESSEDLSVNHALLTFARIYNWAKMNPEETPPISLTFTHMAKEPLQSGGKCPEHGHSQFFLCLRCLELLCRGCVAENHPDPPRGRCNIVDFRKGMNRIKRSHLDVLELYMKEADNANKRLKSVLSGIDFVFQHLKNSEYHSGNQSYELSPLKVMEGKETCNSRITELEVYTNRLKQIGEDIKEANELEVLKSVTEGYVEAEKAFRTFMAKEDSKSLEWLKKFFLPSDVDAAQFLGASVPLYAIQELDGKSRWAEVISKDNKILLYSLQDGKPPKHGLCVPFQLLRAMVPRESPIVFMDFGGDGEYKGRSYIQMFGDTARGRQAVLLCSGERGPSYRKTQFYCTYFHEDEDACLKGGDYENNDGTGGRAIVDDITDDEIYKMEIRSGLIVGWPADEHYRLGSFRLYTFDYDWITAEHAFGEVVENLELVTEELGLEDDGYEDPFVMDCGLVLIM